MKKTVYAAILFALYMIPARAGNPKDPLYKKNIISFNLVTPFDKFPRIRMGYTYIMSPKISCTSEIGYGKRGIFPNSSFIFEEMLEKNYRLWEVRNEVRYYFTGIRKYLIPYAGAETYYINHKQTMFDGAFDPDRNSSGPDVYYKRADYQRLKYGLNLKAGIIIRAGPLMAFEFYGGFGPRIRDNQYYNITGAVESYGFGWDHLKYYHYSGKHLNLNITAGAKLNFMF